MCMLANVTSKHSEVVSQILIEDIAVVFCSIYHPIRAGDSWHSLRIICTDEKNIGII